MPKIQEEGAEKAGEEAGGRRAARKGAKAKKEEEEEESDSDDSSEGGDAELMAMFASQAKVKDVKKPSKASPDWCSI